jgi:hypothetical protein
MGHGNNLESVIEFSKRDVVRESSKGSASHTMFNTNEACWMRGDSRYDFVQLIHESRCGLCIPLCVPFRHRAAVLQCGRVEDYRTAQLRALPPKLAANFFPRDCLHGAFIQFANA